MTSSPATDYSMLLRSIEGKISAAAPSTKKADRKRLRFSTSANLSPDLTGNMISNDIGMQSLSCLHLCSTMN